MKIVTEDPAQSLIFIRNPCPQQTSFSEAPSAHWKGLSYVATNVYGVVVRYYTSHYDAMIDGV